MMSRLAILFGAGNAALAIVMGAFAAHALKDSLSEKMLSVFQTAASYHIYHALGLILVGLLLIQHPQSRLLMISQWMMLAGIILFCGSLYALSLTEIKWLGMITPLGGLSFIIAWLLVVIEFLKPSS